MEEVVLTGKMYLDDLFAGDEYENLREKIIQTGEYVSLRNHKVLRVPTRKTEDGRYEVLALAAATRDPGKSKDFLESIADFAGTNTDPTQNLQKRVKQNREIYRNEAMINNAVNKGVALFAVGGRYKVRNAKKGKIRNAEERLFGMLNYFTKNVNAATDFGVITSERGIQAVTMIGARHALAEGDWVARQKWTQVKHSSFGTASLPMTLQTISIANLEPVKELSGLGELWYWKPDSELLKTITEGSKLKEVNDVVKKLVDSKMSAELKKNKKVLLTPALLCHVKFRGFGNDPVGESMIEPAALAIRYGRALTAADLVSMENVVNRLTIVQVGSADPKSPYSKTDVAAARAALMQSFFEDPSPSMVIVWQGDDVKVEDVGSQRSLLDLADRYKIADDKIKMAVGLPDELLSGKDAAGASWVLQELANSFTSVFTTLGERIAKENGFEDVDLVWEFDASLKANYKDTRAQNRADYLVGAISLHTLISAAGRDPDAEFILRCQELGLDPTSTLFGDAFKPPQGMQGQAKDGVQGMGDGKDPGAGRTPEDDKSEPKDAVAE
jgi:hypothetical protein